MREILFRGKRLDNGEWIQGDIVQFPVHGIVRIVEQEPSYKDAEVDSDTVGQYTGLTDKNSRKIFEGDILAAPDYPNLKYKVSFANANFCVKCPAQPYLFYLGSRCFDMFGNPEYEIVGNVYDSDKEPFDNPELLGGESDG